MLRPSLGCGTVQQPSRCIRLRPRCLVVASVSPGGPSGSGRCFLAKRDTNRVVQPAARARSVACRSGVIHFVSIARSGESSGARSSRPGQPRKRVEKADVNKPAIEELIVVEGAQPSSSADRVYIRSIPLRDTSASHPALGPATVGDSQCGSCCRLCPHPRLRP